MFPPPGRKLAGAEQTAHFAMPKDRVPTVMGTTASPPPGAPRQGVIPYAGRQLPLPAGQWQLLAVGRDEGAQPKQVAVLARVAGTRLGGLLMVLGPDPLSHPSGILETPLSCSAPDVLAGETAAVLLGENPFLHECWTWTAAQMRSVAVTGPKAGLLQRGFANLASMGVAVPDRMLALRYIRSTEFGWLIAEFYVPVRADGPMPPPRAMVGFARKYASLLHRGYDGSLTTGAPTPALPREPG